MAQASLYRYCQPAVNILDSKGPLSHTIALSILAEVSKEVKFVALAAPQDYCWPEEKARFI